MRSIMFTFAADTPLEHQEDLLRQVHTWNEVAGVGRLKADSSQPEIRRMGHVYLKDDADAQSVVERLRNMPGIEKAFEPTARRLV